MIGKRYLTKQEAEILLRNLELRNEDAYLMTLISLTTGARAGEILSIRFKDIDFYSKYVTLSETKNGYSRKIKITPKVEALLKSRKQEKANEYLFKTKTNKKFDKIPIVYMKTANSLFNEDLENNDAKNRVVFHTLRHTFASWLAMDGVPIYTIQKLMGHRDTNMTMRYAKLSPEAGIESVMKIERSLFE